MEYRLVLIEKEKKRNDKKVQRPIERIDSRTEAHSAEEMSAVTLSSNLKKESYTTPQNLKRRLNYVSKTEEQKAEESAARKRKISEKSDEQKDLERSERKQKYDSRTDQQKTVEKNKRDTKARMIQFEKQRSIEVQAAAELLIDRTSKDSVAYDAKRFSKMMDDLTIFDECFVCGLEKSQSLMSSATVSTLKISVVDTSIKNTLLPIYRKYSGNSNQILDETRSNIYVISDTTSSQSSSFSQKIFKPLQAEFDNQVLTLMSTGNLFDKIFASVLYFELFNGVISNLDRICQCCFSSLNPENKKRLSTIPSNALIYGRFKGSVPECLRDLSVIEKSMIALKNPVVKLIIAGGKHYTAKGEMYTIVNDVVNVHNKLPAMPSLRDTAILRHSKHDGNHDYVFRPRIVERAINHLIQINGLWSHLPVVDPSFILQHGEVVHPPSIELSDEEYEDIMETSLPFIPSSNPGIYIHCAIFA
jgi:hypothetical protein